MDDRRHRFEAQVMPHFDAAYRFARWLARSPDGVDDVVQESLLRAYRGFDGLRSADSKSWLLTIVRNCHYTARRQVSRHPWVPLPDDGEGSKDEVWMATTPAPAAAALPGNATRNGCHLAFWRSGDLAYAAVADTGWDELLALQRLLRAAEGAARE